MSERKCKRKRESESVNNSVALLFMLLPRWVIVNYRNDT